MKEVLFIIGVIFLSGRLCFAQSIDTLVEVGNGLQIHFTMIPGKNAPILFESGAGNHGNIWNEITPQIAEVTGATIITYDRLGFGENSQSSPIGFGNEMIALETGLKKLGWANKNMMLVAHSMGGMYASYYASRHPQHVKGAVFIDVSTTCSWSIDFKNVPDVPKDLTNMLDTVIKNPMPLHIPVMDIVAGLFLDDNGNEDTVHGKTWADCHRDFVAQSNHRKSLIAEGVGHYVFLENPSLVVNAIITQYANYLAPKQKGRILERGYALDLMWANENKKNEIKFGQSEEDLNEWGYSLLGMNEVDQAIEVFRLNVTLNPDSWNAYDSLGEAYLASGNKDQAIINYKKSLELNPQNENAVNVLQQLQQ